MRSIAYCILIPCLLFLCLGTASAHPHKSGQSDHGPSLENYITKETVVIDEVQRIPELLNEVHRLIEEKNLIFLLTGSSARSLKKKGVNLLAARAFKAEMLPLTWHEINRDGQFDLDKYLLVGGLPMAYLENNALEYLYNYVETYLKEEIQAEALVRNLSNYHRFLNYAASRNTEIINFTKVGNNAQLSPNTVRDYYQILEDTLIGKMLPCWKKSTKRKSISSAKFYFFDAGVVNALKRVESLPEAGSLYGYAFEQFIFQELTAYLSYNKIRKELTFWRSKNDQEVDFLIGDEVAIEVKSTKKIIKSDQKGLIALMEEKIWTHTLLVSRDKVLKQNDNGIIQIYWKDFLENLWAGKYL